MGFPNLFVISDVAAPDFDTELFRRHDLPGPGYISYPTPRHFESFTPAQHAEAVARACASEMAGPLSVYVHVPLCTSPCFWCGCAKVEGCDLAGSRRYLETLLKEIELQSALLPAPRPIEQLHLGGTPSSFDDEQIAVLMRHLEQNFGFARPDRREFAFEIDLRRFDRDRLARLAAVGFNRIIVGIKDAEGVAVIESPLAERLSVAHEVGIRSVGVDLVYGLPGQSPDAFDAMLERVVAREVDRVGLFGFTHLGAVFKATQSTDPQRQPDAATRLEFLERSVQRLTAAGYVHIGTDHFARPGDELAVAAQEGRLQRNLQGYATRAGLDLLGLGATAISRLGGAYSQNARTIAEYEAAIDAGQLATVRGRRLTGDDQLRATVIERILCGREVRYGVLEARYGVHFKTHFQIALRHLRPAVRDRLVQVLPDRLAPTHRGRYLLRTMASAFDAYFEQAVPPPSGSPKTT
jgi:oxygen-independent coproporphyrinogen-3 oxidase